MLLTLRFTLLLSGEGLLAVIVIVGGLLVAWARIFPGVHFPLDMIGAIGVAIIAFFLLSPVSQLAGVRITRRLEDVYRRLLFLPITAGWIRR
jgi:undecaprenyl-diphosphatase